MQHFGKILIFIGLAVVIIGILIWFWGDKIRFLGRLPGDIRIERSNFKVYIPVTTMLLLSIILSAILWIIQKFLK
jgi:hypothetical protein